MARVVPILGETVSLEHVRHALNALPGESKRASDLGNRQRRVLNHRQHLPPRRRLPCGSSEHLPFRGKETVEPEEPHDNVAERVASARPHVGTRAINFDSMLSYWYCTHDSILSYRTGFSSVGAAEVLIMDWKLELVSVPVSDVDRAKAFYTDKVGFNADYDHKVSDSLRFVQLTPVGSACSIAIGIGITDKAPGSVAGLQLVVADADAARAELVSRGVEVGEVQDLPWGRFVFFTDPDGNGWSVQQVPARQSA